MKNNFIIIGILLSILFAIVTFYATNDLLCCVIVLTLTLLYFSFIFNKSFSKYKTKITRFHECYIFINNFIISLSIKSSLIGAFESVTTSTSDELKKELYKIRDMKEIEKMIYLISYFKFDDYRLFCDIVSLWIEEGGNILSMSSHVTNHIREVEEYINYSESKSKSKLIEFCLLWAFTLSIIVILRLVLNEFLSAMLNNLIFKLGVVLVFAFLLISLHLFMMKMTNLEIGGWKNDKK